MVQVIFIILSLCCFVTGDIFNKSITISKNVKFGKANSKSVLAAMELAKQMQKAICSNLQVLPSLGATLGRFTCARPRFAEDKLEQSDIDNHYCNKIMSKGMTILLHDQCKNCSFKEQLAMVDTFLAKNFTLGGICTITSKPDKRKLADAKIRTFRTADGSYNNLVNPIIGQTGNVYSRLVPSDYCDGIQALRCSKYGSDLPPPRVLSAKAFSLTSKPDLQLSMMFAEFPQFLTHDMALQKLDNDLDTNFGCCTANQSKILPPELLHESCIPMTVPADDPFYRNFGIGCLHMVRSVSSCRTDCRFNKREQINKVSAWIDLSPTYGNNKDDINALRSFTNGKLLEGPNKHMPPGCGNNINHWCYDSGDVRANQQIHLIAYHTIFFRNHNRYCDMFKIINSFWNDERLFHEARRLNIAIFQHIVYTELLRLLIGDKALSLFETQDQDGFTTCYSPFIDGSTTNDFSIAFRTLHAFIPGEIGYCDKAMNLVKQRYSKMITNVTWMETKGYDSVILGMIKSPSMQFGNQMDSEIKNWLFPDGLKYGGDLLAMDIARERDHGVPGYNKYRAFCNLSVFKSFDDIDNMSPEKIKILKESYAHVDDVDLMVGGAFEEPLLDSKFGAVITCIIFEQFKRSMCGDRFFYTNKNQDCSFTAAGLREIKKISLAQIICATSDNLTTIVKQALFQESETNPYVSCNSLPEMNFEVWKR